ncbi:MAG: hypothetical protein ACPL06_03645 [Candidatus Anstonellales archaeon]
MKIFSRYKKLLALRTQSLTDKIKVFGYLSLFYVMYVLGIKKTPFDFGNFKLISAKGKILEVNGLISDNNIGFMPVYTMENGLKETLEWFKLRSR